MACFRCHKPLPYEPHPAKLAPHFCRQRCYSLWWAEKFFGEKPRPPANAAALSTE